MAERRVTCRRDIGIQYAGRMAWLRKARKIPGALLLLAVFWAGEASAAEANTATETAGATKSEALFLDRLMMVESGGRLDAKNPRSSALGPFQFLRSTFFEVITRNFPELAEGKTYHEVMQLRVDLEVARQAALVYTRENAAFLDERGIKPDPGYLRLAFLLGPTGASSVIAAKPDTQVSELVSSAALQANPFLRTMTAAQLIERAKREAAGLDPLPVRASGRKAAPHPEIVVRCNLKLASCRHWYALAKKRLARKLARNKKPDAAE